MEDRASIHSNRGRAKLRCWKLEHEIVNILSSPDFNPIENVWRILKQRIKHRNRPPRTMAELREAIQEEWDQENGRKWKIG
jgi:hypothetical protein